MQEDYPEVLDVTIGSYRVPYWWFISSLLFGIYLKKEGMKCVGFFIVVLLYLQRLDIT